MGRGRGALAARKDLEIENPGPGAATAEKNVVLHCVLPGRERVVMGVALWYTSGVVMATWWTEI